ncbi:hypothetical protein EV182_003108, partial [Spiromyces aspiralis]
MMLVLPSDERNWLKGRVPDCVHPLHYNIELHLDPEKEHYHGEVTIKQCGGPQTAKIPCSATQGPETLTISIDTALAAGGVVAVTAAFSGRFSNGLLGLYRSKYMSYQGLDPQSDENPRLRRMIVSNFSSACVGRAFPCIDNLLFKASIDLVVTHPADQTVLSTMVVEQAIPVAIDTEPSGGGHLNGDQSALLPQRYVRTKFATTYPMAISHLGLVVGDFRCAELFPPGSKFGERLRGGIWSVKPSANAQYPTIQRHVANALEYYGKGFSMPYPLPKLDIIEVPELEFSTISLWGLILVRSCILSEPEHAPFLQSQQLEYRLYQDIASQWLGHVSTLCESAGAEFHAKLLAWVSTLAMKGYNCMVKQKTRVNLNKLQEEYEEYISEDIPLLPVIRTKDLFAFHVFNMYLTHKALFERISDYLRDYEMQSTTTSQLFQILRRSSYYENNRNIYDWMTASGVPIMNLEGIKDESPESAANRNVFSISQLQYTSSDGIQPEPSPLAMKKLQCYMPLTKRVENCTLGRDGRCRLFTSQDSLDDSGGQQMPWFVLQCAYNDLPFYLKRPRQCRLLDDVAALIETVTTGIQEREIIQLLHNTFCLILIGQAPVSNLLDMLKVCSRSRQLSIKWAVLRYLLRIRSTWYADRDINSDALRDWICELSRDSWVRIRQAKSCGSIQSHHCRMTVMAELGLHDDTDLVTKSIALLDTVILSDSVGPAQSQQQKRRKVQRATKSISIEALQGALLCCARSRNADMCDRAWDLYIRLGRYEVPCVCTGSNRDLERVTIIRALAQCPLPEMTARMLDAILAPTNEQGMQHYHAV